MFAPEGYTSLSKIYNGFLFGGNDPSGISHMSSARELCAAAGRAAQDGGVNQFYRISANDFGEHNMLRAVSDSVCLASPSNQITRLDMKSMRSETDFWEMTFYDLYYATNEDRERIEYPSWFKEAYRIFEYTPDAFKEDSQSYQRKNPNKDVWDFALDDLRGVMSIRKCLYSTRGRHIHYA